MFADAKQRSGSLERTGWRVAAAVWVGGLVAVLVGWLAAAPASAGVFRDADVYVQSAKSGELGGGRLTLRGVGHRVTWTAHPSRFGVVSVKRLHRLLFTPRTPAATGTLHVAGQRGGEELVLRLSRPRYNAARGTVSYKVRRLNKRTLPSPAARASGFRARQFGAASLSILGPSGASAHFTTYQYGVCGPHGTQCWGISGSGLVPDSDVIITPVGDQPSHYRADQNGTVDIRLGKVCGEYLIQAQAANGQPIDPGLDVPCV